MELQFIRFLLVVRPVYYTSWLKQNIKYKCSNIKFMLIENLKTIIICLIIDNDEYLTTYGKQIRKRHIGKNKWKLWEKIHRSYECLRLWKVTQENLIY